MRQRIKRIYSGAFAMNIHEYQAKEILARYGVPVPPGAVAETSKDAEAIIKDLDATRFAVKAQVHAGGRGKAGGVRLVATARAASDAAKELLGKVLVTEQTGKQGRRIRKVYVEAAERIETPLYVALFVDRKVGKIALIGAKEGGDDIEERAHADPDIIGKVLLDLQGSNAGELEKFANWLDIPESLVPDAVSLFESLHKAFSDLDASLIEINPLAVTEDGRLVALDFKVTIDDNALTRHPELAALRDDDELDPVELEAQNHDINFVRMDGDIGVAVNGAGLALATNDMLVEAGGRPANFMDIRTSATSLEISRGFDLLLNAPGVNVVLINIHGGGMTRCDTVAEALGISMRRTGRKLPIVFRAAGNNADFARTVLKNCGITYTDARNMKDAVDHAVALAAGRG
jgi:succinyl-CoA synthetase beta subunit